MASNQKHVTSSVLIMLVLFSVLLAAGPSHAQTTQPATSQAQTTGAAPSKASAVDDQWHIVATPYLWFPGMRGTVGAAGHDASVHASAADILSHFRFGLAGTVELRYKRFLIPLDLMWVRLADDKSLPFPDVGATSANIKAGLFLLTPEIGYRLVDSEKLKMDAVTGFRYWHIGQSLSFEPGTLGLNPSTSENLVDPIVGGRIEAVLSPKVVMNILGDVGGWGAGSQLEYQAVGLLGYKVKPNMILQMGYRYLSIDYRNGGSLFDVIMSGLVFGATINLK